MNQKLTSEWSKPKLFLFRFVFCYFCLFLFFLSNIFPTDLFPFLDFINVPFRKIGALWIEWVAAAILNQKVKYIPDFGGDSVFVYIGIVSFFILSLLLTIGWWFLDRRKQHNLLYRVLHTYCRYYLAFHLFNYGFHKISGVQFSPINPSHYITPLSEWTFHDMLWRFMGASRSYNFFGGLLEVVGAGLLLFRKTSTIGAILCFVTLVNVLMINIGYNIPVKIFVFHYLLICLFIMSNNLKQIYQLFLLHRLAILTIVPHVNQTKKLKWVLLVFKLGLIIFMLLFCFNNEKRRVKGILTKSELYGIYNIDTFSKNGQIIPPLLTDTARWKKFAFNYKGRMAIQFMNDSLQFYKSEIDTITHSIKLTTYADTSMKINLNYFSQNRVQYKVFGICKTDSIVLIMTAIDMNEMLLFKNRNKIRWTDD